MKRNPFFNTWIALAVLVGIAAYAYFVERKHPADDAKNKDKVLVFERAKVLALELRKSDGETVRLMRDSGVWKLTAPAVLADQGSVDSLLTALEGLEVDAVAVLAPKALGDFGLDPPKLRVSLTLDGATTPLEFLVGAEVPGSGGTFAKRGDDAKVLVVAAYAASSLDKRAFDFRDRDLLKLQRDAVRTLEIVGPEGRYTLSRDDRGEWGLTEPLNTLANRWSVDGLVGTLASLRMEAVAAEAATDLKPFGLDKPQRVVTVGLTGGERRVLEIGSAAPGEKRFHARVGDGGLVAIIPGALVEDLAKGMQERRAKHLLDVAAYEVESLDVTSGGNKRTFAKALEKDKQGIETNKWKRTAPEAKDIETAPIEEAIMNVVGLEAAEFIDTPKEAKAYGLDDPALRVALRREGGKPELWVEIARKDGAAYARRNGDNAILKLDAGKADEAIKAFSALN